MTETEKDDITEEDTRPDKPSALGQPSPVALSLSSKEGGIAETLADDIGRCHWPITGTTKTEPVGLTKEPAFETIAENIAYDIADDIADKDIVEAETQPHRLRDLGRHHDITNKPEEDTRPRPTMQAWQQHRAEAKAKQWWLKLAPKQGNTSCTPPPEPVASASDRRTTARTSCTPPPEPVTPVADTPSEPGWRPLTSSESDRLRFSAECWTDLKDIIRGYCVQTIMGLIWFKPHDAGMGQFPVDQLTTDSWREQFTRDHPCFGSRYGISYCIIDPASLCFGYWAGESPPAPPGGLPAPPGLPEPHADHMPLGKTPPSWTRSKESQESLKKIEKGIGEIEERMNFLYNQSGHMLNLLKAQSEQISTQRAQIKEQSEQMKVLKSLLPLA